MSADRLFSAVAAGENVIAAASRLGIPLSETLELIYWREGDYLDALNRAPKQTMVSSSRE